jgi:DNA-binding NarL/FixJ family response regulator
VMLDLHMPDMNGLDLLSAIKAQAPSLPVVVLSSDEMRATVIDALERGATGYICKSSPTDLLAKFLEHALMGQIALPVAIFSESAAAPPDPDGQFPIAEAGAENLGLSARQADVLACLLRGMSNKQICRELDISESTVKSHLLVVFRALKVKSRSQAVIEASRRGFSVGVWRD